MFGPKLGLSGQLFGPELGRLGHVVGLRRGLGERPVPR